MKEFNIPFVGLKEGIHEFNYHIEKKFFEALNYDEFNDVNINTEVFLTKKSTLLELSFKVNGIVNIHCDVTGELYNQDVKGNFSMIVKFGEEYNNDDDEILIIPHNEYQINVAQYIYELIVLSVPAKRISPNAYDQEDDDTSNKENNTVEDKATDPRWDKLKDLITGK